MQLSTSIIVALLVCHYKRVLSLIFEVALILDSTGDSAFLEFAGNF
jgi:hypothetical protein